MPSSSDRRYLPLATVGHLGRDVLQSAAIRMDTSQASTYESGVRNGVPMIYPYDHESLARWERGDLQVKIVVPTSDRPVAYCDGTDQDEQVPLAIAEAEGTELPTIRRKVLKTGRQVWTVETPIPEVVEDW